MFQLRRIPSPYQIRQLLCVTLTSIIQKRRDAVWTRGKNGLVSGRQGIILTVVPKNDWKRPAGRPRTSWLATMKNELSPHNLSVEDATELEQRQTTLP